MNMVMIDLWQLSVSDIHHNLSVIKNVMAIVNSDLAPISTVPANGLENDFQPVLHRNIAVALNLVYEISPNHLQQEKKLGVPF